MELIDDDDVEVVGCEVFKSVAAQALNGCKNVVPTLRPTTGDPKLAETRLPKRHREGPATLFQELMAMCHEQQPTAPKPVAKARVIDGCHHSLPCSRRRDEKVAML